MPTEPVILAAHSSPKLADSNFLNLEVGRQTTDDILCSRAFVPSTVRQCEAAVVRIDVLHISRGILTAFVVSPSLLLLIPSKSKALRR
jgi:hypothetical protein